MISIINIISDSYYCPICILWILLSLWIFIKSCYNQYDIKHLTIGYKDMLKKQYWKLYTFIFCNNTILLLIYAIVSLWSNLSVIERRHGIFYFFSYSLVLILSQVMLYMFLVHIIIKRVFSSFDLPQLHHSNNIFGSTGVILAWITYESISIELLNDNIQDTTIKPIFYFLGLIPLPWNYAPLFSLIATLILSPGINGISNICGMLSGYLFALGVLKILPNLYWTYCFGLNIIILIYISLLPTTNSIEVIDNHITDGRERNIDESKFDDEQIQINGDLDNI